jgi:protein SERAC1
MVSAYGAASVLFPGEHMQLAPLIPNQAHQGTDLFSGVVVDDIVSRQATELALPQTGKLSSELQTDYEYYTTMAPDDRRTLSQKLTIGGRSYEVRMAEQKKERFAMALHRHIAQASSLSQFTHLLSNIESRFNRIIYPMIVDGTSTDIINRRIQEDVVDAFVSTTPSDATDTTSLLVEGALYYLTGNCHVRWDNSET